MIIQRKKLELCKMLWKKNYCKFWKYFLIKYAKIYWNSSKFHWKKYRNFLKNKNALFILTNAKIPLNLLVTLNNYLIFIEINSNTIKKKIINKKFLEIILLNFIKVNASIFAWICMLFLQKKKKIVNLSYSFLLGNMSNFICFRV